MKLRNGFFVDIRRVLSSEPFADGQSDFEIDTDYSGENGCEIKVVYRFDKNFWFTAAFGLNKHANITGSVIASPGALLDTEEFRFENVDGLHGLIHDWLVRLREEVAAIPIQRRLDEQEKLINDLIQKWGDCEDRYFTREEAEEMKAKLDKIEQLLKHGLEQVIASEEDQQERVAALHVVIEDLKAHVHTLKQPGFIRRTASRLTSVFKPEERQKLLGDGAEMAGRLLKGFLGSGDE